MVLFLFNPSPLEPSRSKHCETPRLNSAYTALKSLRSNPYARTSLSINQKKTITYNYKIYYIRKYYFQFIKLSSQRIHDSLKVSLYESNLILLFTAQYFNKYSRTKYAHIWSKRWKAKNRFAKANPSKKSSRLYRRIL